MPYDYKTERPKIFTEQGQVMFLAVRDHAMELIAEAGAVRFDKLMTSCTGDTWTMLACVERMVELGELIEVTEPSLYTQHRVFVAGDRAPVQS